MNTLLRQKRLTVRTDLQDNHLYIFNRAVLEVLQSKPSLVNIKQVPHRAVSLTSMHQSNSSWQVASEE